VKEENQFSLNGASSKRQILSRRLKMKKKLTLVLLAFTFVSFLFFGANQSQAYTLGFYNISNNNATDAATGESQLFVDVNPYGINQVEFYFYNKGLLASSITDIYFDDGSLLSISSIINGSGVDFKQGASPGDLPSGNTANPAFVASSGFTADSQPPAQPNGVNPDENVSIIFDLQTGKTFSDVLAALALPDPHFTIDPITGKPIDHWLRIGIHVQGFEGGGSESFVNNPVPLPAAAWLLGTGLLGMAAIRKRIKK
jgi:hypothetical protein